MTSPFGGDLANPMDQPRGPSSAGYWIGGLLIALGIVGSIVWGVTQFTAFQDEIDDFQRVPVGETDTLEFDEGDYVVYAERGGSDPLTNYLNSVRMRPAGEEGADEIEFSDYTSEFTYDFSGPSGRAQLTFEIEEAGEYEVAVDEGPGTTATTAAFGPSVASDLVTAIVGAFVIAGIGIVAGVILLIVTGVRRRKFRQRGWLQAGYGGGAQTGVWNPGGAPPGYPPQQPAGYPPQQPGGWNPPPPPGGGYPPPPG